MQFETRDGEHGRQEPCDVRSRDQWTFCFFDITYANIADQWLARAQAVFTETKIQQSKTDYIRPHKIIKIVDRPRQTVLNPPNPIFFFSSFFPPMSGYLFILLLPRFFSWYFFSKCTPLKRCLKKVCIHNSSNIYLGYTVLSCLKKFTENVI